MKNSKWSERFIKLAEQVGNWSKDPSTQVGAVITKDKKIISVGFNGFAQGVVDSQERLENRETKLRLTIHSELNAILTARRNLEGCTIYCTYPPCAQCASVIIQAGITRVICWEPSTEFLTRWDLDIKLAKKIFSEAEVTYLELER